ncbi:nitrilase [Alkalispirochaeta odontotermitis]|nr:nitrilase [Alkalispirochaeta odontotermitis]CAB1083215.1 Putative hydrolase [Olavius algarvensis Delta 1 endosymbiont]
MQDIRIAAAVFNSIVNRPQDNLDRMVPLVQSAEKQGVQLICFPELNVTGYSTRAALGDAAEKIPGPISRRLQQMAQESQIVILAGMAEKDEKGCIYASHLIVTPHEISGIYRKVHIAPPERDIFSAGNATPVFRIEDVNLGIQLCYDVHFPELATRMALGGADIIFMPHASPRGTPAAKLASWLRHLTARAFDNSVYIVACNQNGDNQNGLQFPGVAVVIDPSGLITDKYVNGRDGIIVTDLKSDAIQAVRGHRMRYFLPNRRPEIYYPD